MDPLREGGYAAGEEGRGESRKQAEITAVFPENYYFTKAALENIQQHIPQFSFFLFLF